MMGSSLPIWANDKDEQLVRDAVYLLEEVKRLRKGIIDFANKWKHNYSTKELLEMIE